MYFTVASDNITFTCALETINSYIRDQLPTNNVKMVQDHKIIKINRCTRVCTGDDLHRPGHGCLYKTEDDNDPLVLNLHVYLHYTICNNHYL